MGEIVLRDSDHAYCDDPAREIPSVVIDASSALAIARDYARQVWGRHHNGDVTLHLRYWRGGYYQYVNGAWVPYPTEDLWRDLLEWLDTTSVRCMVGKKMTTVPTRPSNKMADEVLRALAVPCGLPSSASEPVWLDDTTLDPRDCLVLSNGILHYPTRRLLPHSPWYFARSALTYEYDAAAQAPRWQQLLLQLWPTDRETRETLQQMVGYLISHDTRQQKAFLLNGPKRAGKGTIARTIAHLLGDAAVGHTSLAAMATNFGMQKLLDKRVAILPDVRLDHRAQQQVFVERVLSITGEDAIPVDRKYLDAVVVRSGVRLVMLSNEPPALRDASGAIASRFIVIPFSKSFFGREDLGLEHALTRELPGILNWALDGLTLLQQRERFINPAAAQEVIDAMEGVASPLLPFLRARTVMDPTAMCAKDDVYTAWIAWCRDNGAQSVPSKTTFGRLLLAAHPEIKARRVRESGDRRMQLIGMRLSSGE